MRLADASMVDKRHQELEVEDVILLPDRVLERLAYLAGVYKCIQQLFREPDLISGKSGSESPTETFTTGLH
jgi:hypothetical protein